MEQDLSKKLDRIETLVEDLAAATAKSFAALEQKIDAVDERLTNKIDDLDERLTSRIDGLQRAIDSGFERQCMLEARVSKVEAELHL